MKRLAIAAIASLIALPAASETFFHEKFGAWRIGGNKNVQARNDSCIIDRDWNGMTKFSLVRDMYDGELYMIIQNPAWKIANPPGAVYSATIDFDRSRNHKINYEVLSQDIVRFRELKAEVFIPLFLGERNMMIKMPGNIPSINIPLDGTRQAFDSLVDCMRTYESTKAHPPKTGNNL